MEIGQIYDAVVPIKASVFAAEIASYYCGPQAAVQIYPISKESILKSAKLTVRKLIRYIEHFVTVFYLNYCDYRYIRVGDFYSYVTVNKSES